MKTTGAEKHQERWQEIVDDPALQDLPYQIETNSRGQIVLSPPKAKHPDLQGRVLDTPRDLASEGRGLPEFPIATTAGVRVADVVWMTCGRLDNVRETGDPPTQAPDVCVKMVSETNTEEEMREKRTLYRNAGAEEVWVVDEDGSVRFFAEEEKDASELVPAFPDHI